MRNKVIRAYLGVYIAVCVTYGILRGIVVPAAAENNEVLTEPIPEIVATVEAPEISIETSGSGRSRGRHGRRGSTEMYNDTLPSEKIIAPAQADEPKTGEKLSEDTPASGGTPTLEEYLKSLHCGGCGRNCFLFNPRCMRGARKASKAETAYYAEYGES